RTQPLAALEIGLDGGELKLLCVLVHVENPKSWMGVQLFGGSSRRKHLSAPQKENPAEAGFCRLFP
ncbi:hypothetical protein, partial [Pseudomonas lundensis]|uniref:hypothetical protein n=1 Tax=Pseudomonas lundensis TaxID=86185 RepID=UPI0019D35C90